MGGMRRMDLGLDQLLEMFEERFGRRATTILIALISAAVAAWSLHAIVEFIIAPTVAYIGGFTLPPPDRAEHLTLLTLWLIGGFYGLAWGWTYGEMRTRVRTLTQTNEILRNEKQALEARLNTVQGNASQSDSDGYSQEKSG